LMIADYEKGQLDTTSTRFKILTGIACLIGLTVPILGSNPIRAQILTQVFNIFVLPAVVAGMAILINRSELMGRHRAGILMNIGLALAFVFSCLISWTGAVAIWEKL